MIPSDFPWRAGMRVLPNEAGGHHYARVLTMDDDVPTVTAVEMPIRGCRTHGPWIEAWSEHGDNTTDEPDPNDPATVGAFLGALREAFGEPTLHTRPDHVDRPYIDEPIVVWGIERVCDGEWDWLRESGAWGAMADGHKDPPIAAPTEWDALCAAWAGRPVRSWEPK